MRGLQAVIELTGDEREELTMWSNSRTLPAGDVFKARLVLALAEGASYSRIEAELGTSRRTIPRWKARFEEARIAGLEGTPYRQQASQGDTRNAGPGAEENPAEAR